MDHILVRTERKGKEQGTRQKKKEADMIHNKEMEDKEIDSVRGREG